LIDPASDRKHSVLGLPQTSQLLKKKNVVRNPGLLNYVVTVGPSVHVCV
ncbi:hypothetical protein QTP70_020177, partial [Hemibagrus guttatus]